MGMNSLQTALAAIVSCIVIGGTIWRIVSWHNDLVSHLDQNAADLKHQHELQNQQIEAVREDLREFKAESKRNFSKVFSRIDDIAERVAKLEGKS